MEIHLGAMEAYHGDVQVHIAAVRRLPGLCVIIISIYLLAWTNYSDLYRHQSKMSSSKNIDL